MQAAVCRDWYFFAGGLAAVHIYCVKMQVFFCLCSFPFCQGKRVSSVPAGRSRFVLVSSYFEGQNGADLRRDAWEHQPCKWPSGGGKRRNWVFLAGCEGSLGTPGANGRAFLPSSFPLSSSFLVFSCVALPSEQKSYLLRPSCCAAGRLSWNEMVVRYLSKVADFFFPSSGGKEKNLPTDS